MSLDDRIAERIRRYRDHPAYFMEHELRSKPYYYNVPFLESRHPMLVYHAGRQVGKSNTIAAKLAHFCLFANYRCHLPEDVGTATAVIVSYKEDQAEIIFNRMVELMERSELCQGQLELDHTNEKIYRWLLGGGKTQVKTLALGGSGVGGRSPSPSIIIVDEYDHVGVDRLDGLLPAGAARDAMWWIASSPNGKQGPMYQICKTSRLGSLCPIDDVYTTNDNAEWEQHCAITTMNPGTTDRYINMLRKRLSAAMFRQEVYGEFIDTGAYMYPSDVLVHSLNLDFDEDDLPMVDIGLDVSGMGADETVWIVIKHDGIRGKIVDIRAQGISNTNGIAEITREMVDEVGAGMVHLENNGIGKGVADVLRDDGYPVDAEEYGLKKKMEMHVNCLKVLEGSSLDTSYCKNLRHPLMEQAMMISREAMADGRMKLVGGRHDDYPAALALGCLALSQGRGMEVVKMPRNKQTNQPIIGGRRRRPQVGGLLGVRSRRIMSSAASAGNHT